MRLGCVGADDASFAFEGDTVSAGGELQDDSPGAAAAFSWHTAGTEAMEQREQSTFRTWLAETERFPDTDRSRSAQSGWYPILSCYTYAARGYCHWVIVIRRTEVRPFSDEQISCLRLLQIKP